MKHIFVINPTAGPSNSTGAILTRLAEIFAGREDDFTYYITKRSQDAIGYVRTTCEQQTNEELCFYACGGDGTLNEVVNGAFGFAHASVACVPCGSGNDFLRMQTPFTSLRTLVEQGQPMLSDLLRVNDRLSVNITNIGLDSNVNYRAVKYKHLPFVREGTAYNLAIAECMLRPLGCRMRLELEEGEVLEGDFLLGAFANGKYYGGEYCGAPKACIDDGLLDICLVSKISRMRIAGLIKSYRLGLHVDNPKFADIITYRQTKAVTVQATEPVRVTVDGEMFQTSTVRFEVLPAALRLRVSPAGVPVGAVGRS